MAKSAHLTSTEAVAVWRFASDSTLLPPFSEDNWGEEPDGHELREARWYSNADIPTIMYGAGESDIRVSGANGIDERVPEACLEQATVILARAMVRFISERRQG